MRNFLVNRVTVRRSDQPQTQTQTSTTTDRDNMNNNVINNGDSEVASILNSFSQSKVVAPQQVQHQQHHRPSSSYDAEAFYNAYVMKGKS